MSDIVERLRGIYRVPINDGFGKVEGNLEPENEKEFVRQFQSPPIQIEAADEIERLRAELASQTLAPVSLTEPRQGPSAGEAIEGNAPAAAGGPVSQPASPNDLDNRPRYSMKRMRDEIANAREAGRRDAIEQLSRDTPPPVSQMRGTSTEADDQYQAEFAVGYRDGYADGLKDGSKSSVASMRYIADQWPETSAGKYARAALSAREGSE